MARHSLYDESPHLKRHEDGSMKVEKMDKEADEGKEKGVKEEGFDEHEQRHGLERLAMHHKHMHEHMALHHKHESEHAHHEGEPKKLHERHEHELEEMHARQEKEHEDMHTRHEKDAGSVGSATVNTAAKKIDKEGVA